MMKKRKKSENENNVQPYLPIIIVIILILSVISSIIIYNSYPLLFGEEIILATLPVDPFDPFRGQYMNIRYDISHLNNSINANVTDTVYVSLIKDDLGIHRFSSISQNKPDSSFFIKGKVRNDRGNTIEIEYGIEQFFFERNAVVPTENITVKVAVTKTGRAKLIELLQDGYPVTITYENKTLRS